MEKPTFLYTRQGDCEHVRLCGTVHGYPWHVHARHAVICTVRAGSVLVFSPGGKQRVAAEESCIIPAGMAHALEMRDGTIMDSLCVPETKGGGPALPASPVEWLRSRMLEAPGEELPLRRMARLAGFSPWHLVRCFKEATGMTPHAYLLASRLSLGRRLLISGLPIAEAALQAGFSDQSHFSRLFKQHHGLTPRVFQQACLSTGPE